MKKIFIYGGVIIAILLLLYFGTSFWLVRGTAAVVEARRQAILDAGDKVYLTDYETDPIPDEENAYYYLMLAQSDLERFDDEYNAIFEDIDATFEDFEQRRVRPEDADKLAALVAKHSELFQQLETVVACPSCRPQRNYADGMLMLMDDVFLFRSAARAFSSKALAEAYRGDGDAALKQCEHSLVLSAKLSCDPILVSHLVHLACQTIAVRTANHVLRVADTSPEARESLDKVLSALDNRQVTIDAMKGERAFGIYAFQQIRDGTLATEEMGEPELSPLSTFSGTWLVQAYLNDDEAMYIKVLNRQIEAIEMDRAQRKQAIESAFAEIEENGGFRHMMTRMLAPALNAAIDANDRNAAQIRCLRVLLAIAGQETVELDDVDLPDVAKTDPFSGKPLLLKQKDDGWIIYSVGEDEIDNGGEVYSVNGVPPDQGLAPLREPLDFTEDAVEFDEP